MNKEKTMDILNLIAIISMRHNIEYIHAQDIIIELLDIE